MPTAPCSGASRGAISTFIAPSAKTASVARCNHRDISLQEAKQHIVDMWKNVHERLQGPHAHGGKLTLRLGSLEMGDAHLGKAPSLGLYATRDLWRIFLLTHPQEKIAFFHQPIDPDIIHYYIDLCPPTSRRERLSRYGRLYTLYPQSAPKGATGPTPLSTRVQTHAQVQRAAHWLIKAERQRGAEIAGLSVFQTSKRAFNVAQKLDIPLLAAHPTALVLGTKHGSREVFKAAGVPMPLGCTTPVYDPAALADTIAELSHQAPHIQRWMIKLSDGCTAGSGNAQLDLAPLGPGPFQAACIAAHLPSLQPVAPIAPAYFLANIPKHGAIVEAFLAPKDARGHVTSPSVQGHIDVDGHVELLSSHEQVLDGETGQIYRGCTYPADSLYRDALLQATRQVGDELARRGVQGAFAVDFLTVDEHDSHAGGPQIYALEINLRESGTTHPMMTLRLLTGGHMDPSGQWRDIDGVAKFYTSTDNMNKAEYIGLTPTQVINAVKAAGLHFSHRARPGQPARTGVVLHLLPTLREFGKVGAVCIANSPALAAQMAERLEGCLDALRPTSRLSTT